MPFAPTASSPRQGRPYRVLLQMRVITGTTRLDKSDMAKVSLYVRSHTIASGRASFAAACSPASHRRAWCGFRAPRSTIWPGRG